MKKSSNHVIHNYILNPQHPITISLIGTGGNGSLLLTHLARMHLSLLALGHPGLDILAIDMDIVEKPNVGRQAFSFHDIGLPKSAVAISRINMFYNLIWNYIHQEINENHLHTNIIITCTDNIESRFLIKNYLKKQKPAVTNWVDTKTTLYWLDIGNLKDRGQIVLASYDKQLKDVIDLFGEDYVSPDTSQEPSCSLADALQKQDLCINPMMAVFAQKLLWDMFTQGIINYHGFLINLQDLTFNKLPT